MNANSNAVIVSLPESEVNTSPHSRKRMSQRGIRQGAIEAVVKFGRIIRGKGCRRFFLGCKEVKFWAKTGINLEAYKNLHVVMDAQETTVLTVYRNPRTRTPGYSRTATQ